MNDMPLLRQFLKFGTVGAANTALDFLILNALSAATGTYAGPRIILINLIAWSAAVTQSYFLNKRWTFRHAAPHAKREYAAFLAVNAGGAGVNSAIVFFLTTFIAPPFGIHPQLWLNAAKLLAIPVSMLSNFAGAKWVVFRKRKPPHEEVGRSA